MQAAPRDGLCASLAARRRLPRAPRLLHQRQAQVRAACVAVVPRGRQVHHTGGALSGAVRQDEHGARGARLVRQRVMHLRVRRPAAGAGQAAAAAVRHLKRGPARQGGRRQGSSSAGPRADRRGLRGRGASPAPQLRRHMRRGGKRRGQRCALARRWAAERQAARAQDPRLATLDQRWRGRDAHKGRQAAADGARGRGATQRGVAPCHSAAAAHGTPAALTLPWHGVLNDALNTL